MFYIKKQKINNGGNIIDSLIVMGYYFNDAESSQAVKMVFRDKDLDYVNKNLGSITLDNITRDIDKNLPVVKLKDINIISRLSKSGFINGKAVTDERLHYLASNGIKPIQGQYTYSVTALFNFLNSKTNFDTNTKNSLAAMSLAYRYFVDKLTKESFADFNSINKFIMSLDFNSIVDKTSFDVDTDVLSKQFKNLLNVLIIYNSKNKLCNVGLPLNGSKYIPREYISLVTSYNNKLDEIDKDNFTLEFNKSEDQEVFCEVPNVSYLVADYMNAPNDKLSEIDALPEDMKTYYKLPEPVKIFQEPFLHFSDKTLHSVHYASAAKTYGIPVNHITGSDNQNDMDILPNEMRYYKALCKLIDIAVKNKDKIQQAAVLDYFGTLVDYITVVTRSHTCMYDITRARIAGTLKLSGFKFSSDGDDEDESSDSRSIVASLSSALCSSPSALSNPANRILNSKLLMETSNNSHIYPEAIVKLLRWGRKKITRLKIQDNLFFDLNSGLLVTDSGYLSDPKDLGGGKTEKITAIVVTEHSIKDSKYESDLCEDGIVISKGLPIGVVTSSYPSTSSGDVVEVKTVKTFIDIILDIKSGNNNILDLEVSPDGKIYFSDFGIPTLSVTDANNFAGTNNNNYSINYLLKMIGLNYNCKLSSLNSFSIVNNFYYFSDVNDVLRRSNFDWSKTKLPIKSANSGKTTDVLVSCSLIKILGDVFVKASHDAIESSDEDISLLVNDLTTIFNSYNIEIIKSGLASKLKNLGSPEDTEKESIEDRIKDSVGGTLGFIDAFNSKDNKEETEEDLSVLSNKGTTPSLQEIANSMFGIALLPLELKSIVDNNTDIGSRVVPTPKAIFCCIMLKMSDGINIVTPGQSDFRNLVIRFIKLGNKPKLRTMDNIFRSYKSGEVKILNQDTQDLLELILKDELASKWM